MTKTELLRQLQARVGPDTPKAELERILAALVDVIEAAVQSGDSVSIPGLGRFALKKRAARIGRDPQTGAVVKVKPKRFLTYKPIGTFVDIRVRKVIAPYSESETAAPRHWVPVKKVARKSAAKKKVHPGEKGTSSTGPKRFNR